MSTSTLRLHRSPLLPAWLILLGALLYAAWTLEALLLLPEDLDPRTSYVSELSAQDQPLSGLFRATDALAGTSVAVGALLAFLRLHPTPRLGWWAIVGFGVATIADAALPLSCAATQDPVCAAAEAASAVPWNHTFHVVTSSVASVALIAAIVVFLPAARAHLSRPWWVGLVLTSTVCLVGTAWTLLEVARPVLPLPWESALGYGQRLQLIGASAWVAVVGGALRRHHLLKEADR